MISINTYKQSIFSINDDKSFQDYALWAFRYQIAHNPVYKRYTEAIKADVNAVKTLVDIPFLPISFFKTHAVSDAVPYKVTFSSSGTTGATTSQHHVADVSLYETSYRKAFELFYGDIDKYAVLALLPSYLERDGSSLIYMANDLINLSKNEHSGFYLNDRKAMHEKLLQLEAARQDTILLGVSYALLDFADEYQMELKHTVVMETGGMKGRRKEMVREELHQYLCSRLGITEIHSEYGMTELLSQGYSKGKGIYKCPPWMKILIREANDPFSLNSSSAGGGVNIIDLVNIHSCCFLATQDLGKCSDDNSFEILGRFDNSDIRGCNLLIV